MNVDELCFGNAIPLEEFRGDGFQGQIGLGTGVGYPLGLQSFVEAG